MNTNAIEFIKASEKDFDIVYHMMIRAREQLFLEKIFQWDERYPKPDMIRHDLRKGYTSIVKNDGKEVAFFTSNSICEDEVHNDVEWIYNGDNWVILHRLCIDPCYQNAKLGQSILLKFEDMMKRAHFESIRIDVFSTNVKAIHIYEKYSYTRVGQAICERGLFYVYEKRI